MFYKMKRICRVQSFKHSKDNLLVCCKMQEAIYTHIWSHRNFTRKRMQRGHLPPGTPKPFLSYSCIILPFSFSLLQYTCSFLVPLLDVCDALDFTEKSPNHTNIQHTSVLHLYTKKDLKIKTFKEIQVVKCIIVPD